MEKIKELENLNAKVKAALSEATAETGKEAVAAADMRREIKKLKEEVTVLAPLPEQLATAQQQLAQVTESHTEAVGRCTSLATEAAEVGELRQQLAAAVSERDAAASRLAEAQEMQEELQGADDKRKARFAKMKANYDAQLDERDATIRELTQNLVRVSSELRKLLRKSMQWPLCSERIMFRLTLLCNALCCLHCVLGLRPAFLKQPAKWTG